MIETIAFVIGAVVGGFISNYAFKKNRNLINEVLEIVIFYLIAFILSEHVYNFSPFIFGTIGFFSAIAARGISSNFNQAAFEIKKKAKVGRIGLLIGLENALRRRGFEKEEIIKIAKEVGFSKKEVDEVIK